MQEKLKSLVVWDLETTGFVEDADARIIEIGAMEIRDGEVVATHKWILNHGIEIPAKITEITGITKEDIDREGVDPKTALDEFLTVLLRSDHNLTHNGFRFDIPFLEKQLAALTGWEHDVSHYRKALEAGGVDSAVMYKARKLGLTQGAEESFKQFADRVMEIRAFGVKYNVGICCDELGIDRSNVTQHRADADVYLTAEIFKKLASV
jgi:DNA polymerase III epsilon subunit-like protein